MPMPLKVDRPLRLEVRIPTSVHTKVLSELHSEIEGRVPHGELSKLVTYLMSEWLKARGISL